MNVSLPPALESFVLTKVKTGRYNSASEVVREALRLLEDHEKARAGVFARLRKKVPRTAQKARMNRFTLARKSLKRNYNNSGMGGETLRL